MEYYTSDLHFGHRAVIDYENRPFKNAVEMDEQLIKRWNETVPDDPCANVWILGDVSFHGLERTQEIVQQLNGNKHLVLGNHDSKWRDWTWHKIGMQSVHTICPKRLPNGYPAWLAHKPDARETHRLGEAILIHGHLHGRYGWKFQKEGNCLNINVAVELWGYKPAHVSEIQEIIRATKER